MLTTRIFFLHVSQDDLLGNTFLLTCPAEDSRGVRRAAAIRFALAAKEGSGTALIEVSRGAFRFATGSQRKGSYKVKRPYGTLGIRG